MKPLGGLALLCLAAYSLEPVPEPLDVASNYVKFEYRIPMRDGTHLFTSVYVPKNTAVTYPILLTRTPYGVRPYGLGNYPKVLGPSRRFEEDGFIFAFQDVRGRYMSEGEWVEMRPVEDRDSGKVDETTDTYDTIDWLVKNVPNNNGKAGMVGVSYPGFYTTCGLIHSHPALLAASPQAPISDLYKGDDSYHNGAFFLSANFDFYQGFVKQKNPLASDEGDPAPAAPQDGYTYFLRAGSIGSLTNYFREPNPYWTASISHTTYDSFWKSRNILPHLRDITPAVLVVGGWFDAEDLAGTLNTYRAIREQSPATRIAFVMGPWLHGGWQSGPGNRIGDIQFGSNTSEFFEDRIALPFFRHYLKEAAAPDLPPAYTFETGRNDWKRQRSWPPATAKPLRFYFGPRHTLTTEQPVSATAYDQYLSDPSKPVPYLDKPTMDVDPDYMAADQRFARRRRDVLTYETDPLAEDLTIAGPISPRLYVSTTGSDSDFVVKLIDVYPLSPGNKLSGYEQLVRGEPVRGKFRDSFESPRAFKPGQVQSIQFTMPDVYHCFLKGHRIMVQIQSSWFPLVDRNPQTFTDIPMAKGSQFQTAVERIYRSAGSPSSICLLSE